MDLLISLCMDLMGNPMSKMGHMMVCLVGYPKIQGTASGEEFMQKLKGGTFLEEFTKEYDEYLEQFGCHGMREINAGTLWSYEKQGGIFDTLKQININHNQMKNSTKKQNEAYKKLLAMAEESGKGRLFKHHANVIHSTLGYRKHPKFMIVKIVDRMCCHALNMSEEFVLQGRLDNVDQIFSLMVDQITEAQANADLDIKSIVSANLQPYKKVENTKECPMIIDSHGKIIRGICKDKEVEDGLFLGDPISPRVGKRFESTI